MLTSILELSIWGIVCVYSSVRIRLFSDVRAIDPISSTTAHHEHLVALVPAFAANLKETIGHIVIQEWVKLRQGFEI